MSLPIHGISQITPINEFTLINHITFSVSDLERSIAFYQNAFDAKLLLRAERMAYLSLGGLWLALNVQADIPRQEIKQSCTHLAFTIDAAEIGHKEERLKRLGVELRPGRVRDAGEGQSLYFTDPDGHLLEFHTGSLAQRLRAYENASPGIVFYDGEGKEIPNGR